MRLDTEDCKHIACEAGTDFKDVADIIAQQIASELKGTPGIKEDWAIFWCVKSLSSLAEQVNEEC